MKAITVVPGFDIGIIYELLSIFKITNALVSLIRAISNGYISKVVETT